PLELRKSHCASKSNTSVKRRGAENDEARMTRALVRLWKLLGRSHPFAARRSENGKFLHHELSFPEGADHFCDGGAIPPLAHFLAGVAAPALDVSVAREDRAPNLTQLGFVQERFRRAVYVAAVIEHKAGFVRVTKKFKPRHLLTFAVTSGVQIIDNVVAVLKPNEIQIKLVSDSLDQPDQILIFLRLAIEITLFINQPGDGRVRPEPFAQLVGTEPRRANEIRPPMIVRLRLVLFPLLEGGPADQDDPFAFRGLVARVDCQREYRQ